ncbi:MobA/MobL family protein [Facklamia hominis]
MADSFHFSVNIISRGKGKSAVASAAYISGEKIKNEWDGVTHDYTKKQRVISKEIFLPDHAPEEYKDRKTLWNSVELFEKNSNAQLARNFIISLPKELSIEENKKMIEDLNKCLAYAKTVRKTKATYQEYESKKIFKESFYKNNQKEIDQHIRARTLIEKISGKENLREKEWLGEIKNLEDEISKLNTESEKIRERYKEINHIKYAVEVVNKEYGIDLSIEIDKAIKRGEKESIIEKIKEYKQDSDKFNKKRQMTKDYYKNQEI